MPDFVAPGDGLRRTTRANFLKAFGGEAEVVGRAPGRVNLIGEHTDYNAGLCLPVALEHATYAAVARGSEGRLRVTSGVAGRWEGDLADLAPGRVAGWAAYVAGVVWAMREAGLDVPPVDVHIESTVPLGAGLSSSAAIECAVAVALCQVLGLQLTDDLRHQLIGLCIAAETEMADAPTGGMDQSISLLAEPGHALLLDFDKAPPAAVPIPLEEAGLTLLVVDTRVSHALNDGGYAARRADCEAAAAALGVPSLRYADETSVAALPAGSQQDRARHVVTEIDRVRRAVAALNDGDFTRLGSLFEASHASLRDDFEVSCAELDAVTETVRSAGALGARMTGGGFGGSAVVLCSEGSVESVATAVEERFDADGFAAPGFLHVSPAGGAGLC